MKSYKQNISIDLSDVHLFGNDAAEDEEEDVFNSYVLKDRRFVRTFTNPQRRLLVATAYKGEGKSALLRITKQEILEKDPDAIIISTTGTALNPALDTTDFAEWTRAWKATVFSRIAVEIARKIGFTWTDDGMSLVEEAEKQGFRERNIIGAILQRLKLGGTASVGGADIPVPATKKPGTSNPEEVVKRWLEGKAPIWIFVDDADENFKNTEVHQTKVASLLTALRDIANTVPETRLRATIRPNVRACLEFESLSKIDQYLIKLKWKEKDLRRLLARRVEGYLIRTEQWQEVVPHLDQEEFLRDRELIAMVFEDPMDWGKSERPPYVILTTLSKHRPRWLVELSKEAARAAQDHAGEKISLHDITGQMSSFGNQRIKDTVAEFRSLCAQIDEVISAFHRSPEEFSTDELLRYIDKNVLTHLTPKINGTLPPAKNKDVARLLFEVGFIFARKDLADESYEHISFAEDPYLLHSRTATDKGYRWEIHPVFRQALDIRDSLGRER